LNNFEALKIGKPRNHLLKLFTTNFTYFPIIVFIFSNESKKLDMYVVLIMHHIIFFFPPFKKPLTKEIVMKMSRSLAPCAKLLGFERLFLDTKMVASKEEPMGKMSTLSL
jgi:hypothetical protein